jgi:hypothetical protein
MDIGITDYEMRIYYEMRKYCKEGRGFVEMDEFNGIPREQCDLLLDVLDNGKVVCGRTYHDNKK